MFKLSIITVALNNAEGLRRTLRSVSSQSFHDFEQIVVDGDSQDDSRMVIQEFSEVLPHYKWISEKDEGIYDAMNKGIKMAEGDYCLFLNAGDALEDDSVLDVLFKNDVNSDIVSCNAICEKSKYHDEQYVISPEFITASRLIVSYLPHQATLIRRSLFADIHPYDTSFRIVSDWLFFIEALLKYNVSYQHVQLFLSRCETEGISNNPKNNALMNEEFHRGLKKVLPLFFEDYLELREYRRKERDAMGRLINGFSDAIWMRFLMAIRKRMMKMGYFNLKASIKRKLFYYKLRKEDKKKKVQVAEEIERLPEKMLQCKNDSSDVIVSLTSYGKRVKDSVPYAIYSMFKQSKLPNRIVLWLDKDKWNDNNLPYLLKRLMKSGLEIRYCNDIMSYKKLIPSLMVYPDNPIVVVDDDFYYHVDFVDWMVTAYNNSDKKTVFATWGCIPEKREGKYIPYSQWKDCRFGNEFSEYSLFGGGSIYPPHIFDDEVLKEDLFMKLCPTADDIWFWIQEKRMGVNVQLTEKHGYDTHVLVDRVTAYEVYQNDTLYFENCIQGRNDQQLNAVLNYYGM